MTTPLQNNPVYRLYDDLAWIWPIISPPADYKEEAEEFYELIQAYGPDDPRQLLHLGCGAGHLDSNLKKHFKITGVDLSGPMLSLARSLNPDVTYHQGDFRSIRMDEKFDAVILADASDYLLSVNELSQAFRTAYRALRPGGVFCTYAEEIAERFEQNKTGTSVHTRGEIEITAIQNVYDPDPSDTTYELTLVYLIRRSGTLHVEIDRHRTGLFSTSTWIERLEANGFSVEVLQYQESAPMFIGLKENR